MKEFRVEDEVGNLLNDYAEVGSCSMRLGAQIRGCSRQAPTRRRDISDVFRRFVCELFAIKNFLET